MSRPLLAWQNGQLPLNDIESLLPRLPRWEILAAVENYFVLANNQGLYFPRMWVPHRALGAVQEANAKPFDNLVLACAFGEMWKGYLQRVVELECVAVSIRIADRTIFNEKIRRHQ